jgi:hypothetical protein
MKPNIITIEKSGIRFGDLWPLSPILGYDSFALCFCSSWQIYKFANAFSIFQKD